MRIFVREGPRLPDLFSSSTCAAEAVRVLVYDHACVEYV